MKRVAYYYDNRHFGNTVSIYDNEEWYFIVIKDRDDFRYSALTKDRSKYYNIDSQIKKLDFKFEEVNELKDSIEIDFSNIFHVDCPKYISRLLDTGELYDKKKTKSVVKAVINMIKPEKSLNLESCIKDIGVYRNGLKLYSRDEALKLIEILRAKSIYILGIDTFLESEDYIVQPFMEYSPDYTTVDLRISCWDAAKRDILRFSQINECFVYEVVFDNLEQEGD